MTRAQMELMTSWILELSYARFFACKRLVAKFLRQFVAVT